MRILVVIPARSGSKGLKDKNIKLLDNKPLLCHSIDVAKKVFPIEDIFVSTDSAHYAALVKEYSGIEIPFLRPDFLSTDTATTQDVLKHTLNYFENLGIVYDGLMVLQPTSPFRTKEQLEEALDIFKKNRFCDLVASVTITDSNPYYVLFEEKKNGFLEKSKISSATRRQDLPVVFEFNGSIYIYNLDSLKNQNITQFKKIVKFVMPKYYSIDIDDHLDFEYADFLLSKEK